MQTLIKSEKVLFHPNFSRLHMGIECRLTTNMGDGLFVKSGHNIQFGELILMDKPLITTEYKMDYNKMESLTLLNSIKTAIKYDKIKKKVFENLCMDTTLKEAMIKDEMFENFDTNDIEYICRFFTNFDKNGINNESHLYGLSSKINHDKYPNIACINCINNQIKCYAVKNIKENEQILRSYIPIISIFDGKYGNESLSYLIELYQSFGNNEHEIEYLMNIKKETCIQKLFQNGEMWKLDPGFVYTMNNIPKYYDLNELIPYIPNDVNVQHWRQFCNIIG